MKLHKSFTFWLLLCQIGGVWLVSCGPQGSAIIEAERASFSGSQSCASCHADVYQKWKGSHHELAMQEATDATVLAKWDTTFQSNGVLSRFYRDSADFYVNTIGEDGLSHDYKVVYTFGADPLQQYIVRYADGSYQCLQTAWDVINGQWYDLQPDLEIAPEEWIHWTGHAMKWNTACADCHSTDLKKNFDVDTKSYHTTYSEISVGCEACHGPGSQHVVYYESGGKSGSPALKMAKDSPPKKLVDDCARCHSRRSQLNPYYDYTGGFLDHYEPQTIVWPLYEKDGQILDEDYVYGSFVQSKMYANGVSCADCHDVHSMKLLNTGNDLCLKCHESGYNSESHHFHAPGSEGALCINCHMTGRTYMGVDFRRDHSFRVPRPDQSVQYGTPNACTGCHTDKSDEWAAGQIVARFGADRKPHFSDYLLAGSNGDKSALKRLLADESFPDIARASSLTYLQQRLTEEDLGDLKKYLKDRSAFVRNEAVKAVGDLGIVSLKDDLKVRLHDSVRSVRIKAARYLDNWGEGDLNDSAFAKAVIEYQSFVNVNADFAGIQHEQAINHELKGEFEKAVIAYQNALEIDNRYNFSRMNLALLLYKQGRVDDAEKEYQIIADQEPESAHPFYMLGLLYHEQNQPEKGMDFMRQACEKQPKIEAAFYNYALMLIQQNNWQQAQKVISIGLDEFQNNERLMYLQKLLYSKSGQK